MGDVVKSDS